MDRTFRFSNTHADYQARDAKNVFGWRYSPRIIFRSGQGVKLTDMDGNDYYDLSSGMMSLPLGHSHPELAEVIKEMAGTFMHQSSWYSNPWAVEFAERLTENTPGNLNVVNFAVTGSEANEIAMRMAGENDPSRCVMIDDLPRTTQAAREAGFFSILFGKDMPHPDADATLTDWNKLSTILNGRHA